MQQSSAFTHAALEFSFESLSLASREASGGHAWGVPRPDKTGQRSGMGCISSKAFKGEGQRLGTAPTASTKGPQRVVAQRISPSTAIPGQQAPKPTNKTGGSGPSDDMRSAAARAAAQRADSVSQAICDVPGPTNVGAHKTFVPRSSHSRALAASTKRDEH